MQFWYPTAFLALFLVTATLLLISPFDLIYQSAVIPQMKAKTAENIISVTTVLSLAVMTLGFVWTSRAWARNKRLREVPMDHMPLAIGEVPKKVNKMIAEQWDRSNGIALDSRPTGVSVPGWSLPTEARPESYRFFDALKELPQVIEARAVSFAPADPHLSDDETPDPAFVDLLQRQRWMCMRKYLGHLADIGVVQPTDEAEEFVKLYEYGRYSECPLTQAQFDKLFAMAADIVSTMTAPHV